MTSTFWPVPGAVAACTGGSEAAPLPASWSLLLTGSGASPDADAAATAIVGKGDAPMLEMLMRGTVGLPVRITAASNDKRVKDSCAQSNP